MTTTKVDIRGYYKESLAVLEEFLPEGYDERLLYFVAFENSNDRMEWVEGYNVIDGHFELQDEKYLISCQEISKEEYMKATQGMYTPEEYL